MKFPPFTPAAVLAAEAQQLAETGGPAFPIPAGTTTPFIGMTLRDWFAGQALNGMLASAAEWDGSTECRIALTQDGRFAMAAFVFADAMLAERAKGQK